MLTSASDLPRQRPHSADDPKRDSNGEQAFELLHPRVQDLIRVDLGWRSLRPIQVAALRPVLAAQRDVLIISGTASGKTEAAWFPMLSRALSDQGSGLSILALSPLKALIDDQTRRLSRYGRHLGLRVEGWHGDVAHARKLKMFDSPPQALVITPESLQGLILRRATELDRMLHGLRYVLIDEVHAFAGTDRGQQVQSLLHQIELLVGRRIPRIALSATVSDPVLMTQYLRPGDAGAAVVVRAEHFGLDLDVRLSGLLSGPARMSPRQASEAERGGLEVHARDVAKAQRLEIAKRIDRDTRGQRSLVFAGSRLAVEEMTSLLRDPEVTGTFRPDRYHAHHGSLSRELRKGAETALRENDDAVVVCTSTLELGIDLPDLDQVTQVDTCLAVAGLRQRLGRSGRRPGARSRLRIYVSEPPEPAAADFAQRLRSTLVQNIASVQLIREGDWVEPPDLVPLGLSTLVHQSLAMLAHPNGVSARLAWQTLCADGPWKRVTPGQYENLLRSLAEHGLIRQDARGLLALDEKGLRLSSGRSFLAVFATPAEYTVRHQGKELGTLPFSYPLSMGSALVMGGRTWRVVDVQVGGWTVDVVPHASGLPPKFRGGFGQVHRRVREVMHALYLGAHTPDYLDQQARMFLAEARAAFIDLALDKHPIVQRGETTLVSLWTGDREIATLTRWMETLRPGFVIVPGPVGVVVKAPAVEVQALVEEMSTQPPPSALDLAASGATPPVGKYDEYLPPSLMVEEFASRSLDVPGALAALEGCRA